MLGPVQITRVRAFRQLQPFRRGNYAMGHVGSSQFDSTIVVLDTDEGVTGYGEMAVINAAYGDSVRGGCARRCRRARARCSSGSTRRNRAPCSPCSTVRCAGSRTSSRRSTWPAGTSRQSREPSAVRGARCPLRRGRPALQRRHRAPARRGGGPRARARRRGIPPAPGQGRPGSRGRRRAARRRARCRRPRHRALRRRERRLHGAAARGASSARPATSSTRSSSRAAPTPSAPRCGPPPTGRSSSTSRS